MGVLPSAGERLRAAVNQERPLQVAGAVSAKLDGTPVQEFMDLLVL